MKKSTKRQKKVPQMTKVQAERVQDKLRSAIIATTALMEKLEPGGKSTVPYVHLKKYRKMLMEANNYFGWSVAPYGIYSSRK